MAVLAGHQCAKRLSPSGPRADAGHSGLSKGSCVLAGGHFGLPVRHRLQSGLCRLQDRLWVPGCCHAGSHGVVRGLVCVCNSGPPGVAVNVVARSSPISGRHFRRAHDVSRAPAAGPAPGSKGSRKEALEALPSRPRRRTLPSPCDAGATARGEESSALSAPGAAGSRSADRPGPPHAKK